jgi:hypothetical protein
MNEVSFECSIGMGIDADCSEEELDELLRLAAEYSGVCNPACRPTPVTLRRV